MVFNATLDLLEGLWCLMPLDLFGEVMVYNATLDLLEGLWCLMPLWIF
jgi:hypothetical protein